MEGSPAVVRSEQPGRDRERCCSEGYAEQKEGGIEGRVRRRADCRREKLAELGLRSQGQAGEEWPAVCAWQRPERGLSTSRHSRCTNYVCKPGANMSQNLSGSLAGRAVLQRQRPAVSTRMKQRRCRTALLQDTFLILTPWTRTPTLYLLIIPST